MMTTRVDSVLRRYLAVSKRAIGVASIVMLVYMVAANGLEIGGRNLFGLSFGWVQETSILAAMWVYFLAYALIAKDGEYIRVEFFVDRLGDAWRARVTLLARLLTMAFYGIVFWFAIETHAFLGLFRTSVLDWPESLFVLPLLLAAFDIVVTETIYLLRPGLVIPRPPAVAEI
jgi:TRAP-type C4-dicarboxylate transport system permease small subunit